MEQFDLDVGDEIPKADQIKMFIELNKSMNHTMANYVGCARYDRAVDLRDRQDAIRHEFAQMQHDTEGTRQSREGKKLIEANEKSGRILRQKQRGEKVRLDASISEMHGELSRIHGIQGELLNRELLHRKPPIMKCSRQLLDMKNSEHQLGVQRRFEEAKEVHKRKGNLLRVEQDKYFTDIQNHKDKMRSDLKANQDLEKGKRVVKLKEVSWVTRRNHDLTKKLHRWNGRQNTMDMKHAHVLEAHKKAEFGNRVTSSCRPSVSHRKNHKETSASYKGTHKWHEVADGRAAVAGLCQIHGFTGKMPEGTVEMDLYAEDV
jgi:hypothetical protein